MSVVRDQLEAISTIRQAVRSQLRQGPRKVAENLFELLENAVRNRAEAASGVFLSSPRDRDTLADLVNTTKDDKDFKDTLNRIANALALCRPDDPRLMPPSENRAGVACILAFIEEMPHLVIVRGLTSKIRNPSADEDHLLRLEVEFRPLSLAVADAALQHPAVLSLRHTASNRSIWRPRLFTGRTRRLLMSFALLGAIASISVTLVMRQRHEAAEAKTHNRIEVKRLLDEAIDALGGNPGTRYVEDPPGFDRARSALYEVARRKIEQASALDPTNTRAANAMGMYYMLMGDLDKAAIYYQQAILLDPTNDDPLCNLGDIYLMQDKVEPALQYYARAIQVAPNEPPAYVNQAAALLRQYTHWPRILPKPDERLFDPNVVAFAQMLDEQDQRIYQDLARRRQVLVQAEASARCAVKLEPHAASPYRILGNILHVKGNLAAATEAYVTALRLQPDDPYSHYDYALELGGAHDYAAAVTQLVQAIRLNRNYAKAFAALSYALHSAGKEDLAVAALLETNRLAPNDERFSWLRKRVLAPPDVAATVNARAHVFEDDYGKLLLHELSAADAR